MTFELRTYTSVSGRMDGLLARFRDHTDRIFATHGMHSVGYWLATDDANTLIYVLRHDGNPAENWADFQKDPAWISAKAASVENGELVAAITSRFMDAADFSPVG
jgi:hypothetical protein